MTEILLKDLYRYEGERCRSLWVQIRYILFTPGFSFTYCFRKARAVRNPLSRFLWRVLHRRAMFHSGIQIPIRTEIGEGLRFGHFGTIIVNPDAKIGRNFTISPGTVIGNAQGKRGGVPTIGDNVVMCANSVVVGGVKIGDYVIIAPGAFVNTDVPDNSIVVGNPGRIIPADRPTDKYNVYLV